MFHFFHRKCFDGISFEAAGVHFIPLGATDKTHYDDGVFFAVIARPSFPDPFFFVQPVTHLLH